MESNLTAVFFVWGIAMRLPIFFFRAGFTVPRALYTRGSFQDQRIEAGDCVRAIPSKDPGHLRSEAWRAAEP